MYFSGSVFHPMTRIACFFIVFALGMVGRANALEAGEKQSFAQIETVLSEEHQVEVANAKYVLNPDDPRHSQVLRIKFTLNAKGEGYVLMVNGIDDAHATTTYIFARLKNAREYDPHNIGVIPHGISANSSLGSFIKNAATTGDGLMIHGQLAKKQADGSDLIAGSITILANLSNSHDERISDRVIIFDTSLQNETTLDKIVAYDVRYSGRR
jgi:hypothetical protein